MLLQRGARCQVVHLRAAAAMMASVHPFLVDLPVPAVLAHRGLVTAEHAAAGVVENSRFAIAAAVIAGADLIESDCRVTRDGVAVLFHDASLARVLGDERMVAGVDAGELESMMADRGGLLTLEAALADFPEVRFNIDVKADDAVIPAGRIVAGHGDRVLLTSFSDKRRARALAVATQDGVPRPATSPGRNLIAQLVVLIAVHGRRRAEALLRTVDALQIPEYQGRKRVLTKRLLRYARRAGVPVHVWTVNDPADMRRLAEMGVDGIVTDRTDVALDVLREFRARA